MNQEKRKESDVVEVRLENIKLKNKLKKKELELKSKVYFLVFIPLLHYRKLIMDSIYDCKWRNLLKLCCFVSHRI